MTIAQGTSTTIPDLRTWLMNIAKPLTEKSEFSHWVGARNTDSEQGSNWCQACCQKEVDKLNARDPEGDYFVDGGWDQQSDSPPTCEGCGMALDDTLTEYGIEYELDHYASHRIQLNGKHQASDAFNFLKIIDSAGDEPKHWGRNRVTLKKVLRRLKSIHGRALVRHNTNTST